jgi:hypothetical protein
VDLVVELVAGSAGALTEGVAALEHEVLDDAVEDHPVVQRLVRLRARLRVGPFDVAGREPHEVPHRLGCVVAVEENPDVAG